MANYERIVTTAAGLTLLETAAFMGSSIQFTAFKTGSGVYSGTEDLSTMTDLKSVKQTFGIASVSRKDSVVVVRVVINNNDLTEGYDITEMGLYATDPDTGSEMLYAIILADDYLPPYADAPTSQALEMYFELTESEEGVTFTAAPMEGVYAPAEALAEHVNDKSNPHGVTAEQIGAATVVQLQGVSAEVSEVKQDIANQVLIFSDVSVAVDAWTEDTTYEDYPYKTDVACEGVTADHKPEVTFDVPEAISGAYAPVAVTGDGVVSIYASEIPADAIVIPTIACVKAVGA